MTKQPAQALTAPDFAISPTNRLSRLNQLVAQPLIIPFFVVVGDEVLNGATQLLLPEEDHLCQALGLDGSHESLRVRGEIGTSRLQLDRLHAGCIPPIRVMGGWS